jgi:hypothetical protein
MTQPRADIIKDIVALILSGEYEANDYDDRYIARKYHVRRETAHKYIEDAVYDIQATQQEEEKKVLIAALNEKERQIKQQQSIPPQNEDNPPPTDNRPITHQTQQSGGGGFFILIVLCVLAYIGYRLIVAFGFWKILLIMGIIVVLLAGPIFWGVKGFVTSVFIVLLALVFILPVANYFNKTNIEMCKTPCTDLCQQFGAETLDFSYKGFNIFSRYKCECICKRLNNLTDPSMGSTARKLAIKPDGTSLFID